MSSSYILELLHCDLWGPISVPTMRSQHYFLTIVDDYIRYTWIYLLKYKAETKESLIKFIKFIQEHTEKKVKAIRTDNGMEFHIPEFLNDNGIKHQKTCAYTPQQNGVVERKHQHLLSVTRSLLFQSKLPKYFWGEAVLTATYLINRLPTHVLGNKTPFELFYSKKPRYKHMRAFGCLCFTSTENVGRTKLDARDRKSVV